MSQSKATPTLARPVSNDFILTASLAKQLPLAHPADRLTPLPKLARCSVHWASTSAPNTNQPACQLKPICPPASGPLGLPDPNMRTRFSSAWELPNPAVVPVMVLSGVKVVRVEAL